MFGKRESESELAIDVLCDWMIKSELNPFGLEDTKEKNNLHEYGVSFIDSQFHSQVIFNWIDNFL